MTTLLSTVEAPPRYIPNDPRPSLLGLTREGLADAMGRAGVAEKQRPAMKRFFTFLGMRHPSGMS